MRSTKAKRCAGSFQSIFISYGCEIADRECARRIEFGVLAGEDRSDAVSQREAAGTVRVVRDRRARQAGRGGNDDLADRPGLDVTAGGRDHPKTAGLADLEPDVSQRDLNEVHDRLMARAD